MKVLYYLECLKLSNKRFDCVKRFCDTFTAFESVLVCDQGTLTSPQLWATVHEVKDLRRVQELLKPAQELDALVVSALTVRQHQKRTGAGRTGSLPEACREQGMMKKDSGGSGEGGERVGMREGEDRTRTWEGCRLEM